MTYDFDTIWDRKGTNSEKCDFMDEYCKPKDCIPLWVADMDFKVAPVIVEALEREVGYGIYGYSAPKKDYSSIITAWFEKRFGYKLSEDHHLSSPTVITALNTAVRAFTEKGDAVIIQTPVYGPFYKAIANNERKLVTSSLVIEGSEYKMNLEDFEKKIVENSVKMFILCSPHNPVGRVWTTEELIAVGSICKKHGVAVVSDEIHCDFVHKPNKHHIFASISKDLEDISIICTSASKSFNLAGLQTSNVFIANNELREKFCKEHSAAGIPTVNTMARAACEAAYSGGEAWFDQLLEYIGGNIDFVKKYIEDNIPKIKVIDTQATYLMWLDFSAFGISQDELDNALTNEAKVWLNSGLVFGEEGSGYQRLNVGCSRKVLAEALEQMKEVFAGM